MTEGSLATGTISHRQDIMNHSWGGAIPNDPLIREAFNVAYENGVVLCVSSGNSGNSLCNVVSYPATYRDHMVMKIGANDATGARASFSECGYQLDFIAPGTIDLYIGMDNDGNNFTDYIQHPNPNCPDGAINGTSFASPHAAGVAALMLSYYNNNVPNHRLSHEDCEELMQRFATDITTSPNTVGYDEQTGWGRLNAGAIFDSLHYPKFVVRHYEFTVVPNSATLVGSHEKTCLEQSLLGLPIGTINVNRWQITATAPYTLPPGYNLIDGWARGSSSSTIGIRSTGGTPVCGGSLPQYFLPSEKDADLNALSTTSVTMTGYIYELLDASFNHVGWWPFSPSSNTRFAYSLYLVNPTAGINEAQEDISFGMFPNPADNSVTIQMNGTGKENDIVITNVTGQVVKIISGVKDSILVIPVNDFAEGLYFVSVINPKGQTTKKLIVHH